MPRGSGIYDDIDEPGESDEPDGDDRGGDMRSGDSVDTNAETPDVIDADGGEPTA